MNGRVLEMRAGQNVAVGQGRGRDRAVIDQVVQIHRAAQHQERGVHHAGCNQAGERGQPRTQHAAPAGVDQDLVAHNGARVLEQGAVQHVGPQHGLDLDGDHAGNQVIHVEKPFRNQLIHRNELVGQEIIRRDVVAVYQLQAAHGRLRDQTRGIHGRRTEDPAPEMVAAQRAVLSQGGQGTEVTDQQVSLDHQAGVHQRPHVKRGQHVVEIDRMFTDVVVEVAGLEENGILEVDDIQPHAGIFEVARVEESDRHQVLQRHPCQALGQERIQRHIGTQQVFDIHGEDGLHGGGGDVDILEIELNHEAFGDVLGQGDVVEKRVQERAERHGT